MFEFGITMKTTPTSYEAPFLKELLLDNHDPNLRNTHPFNISSLQETKIQISFRKPVTFFIGENGTGKSTLLEAIAHLCGFGHQGGGRNYVSEYPTGDTQLFVEKIRLSWFPKVSRGLFMRAETFFNFSSFIDGLSKDDPSLLQAYGGKSLNSLSHGEAFLKLLTSRVRENGIYLLDEPEGALSPNRQLSLLSLLNSFSNSRSAQFIIATHSPILMSLPDSDIISFDTTPPQRVLYEETDHFLTTKNFLNAPERYFRHLFDGQ